MKKVAITPRSNWQSIIESQGLVYHSNDDGTPYWNEAAYYHFTAAEVDELEQATAELYSLCLQAVGHVIENNRLSELCIPPAAHERLRWSWTQQEPALFGRFDLAYDGSGPPKMLEFNADTPTTIVEAAVTQWYWMQDLFPQADQFNSIWEGLVETWGALRGANQLRSDTVHFVTSPNDEDWMTIRLLRDTAEEAGVQTAEVFMRDIGWDTARRIFVDTENAEMRSVFKLYPWEWLLKDPFGQYALDIYPDVQWIEPLWKFALSSKGLLPVLWEMFPNHPNLVAAYAGSPRGMTEYVAKPVIGREGANVTLHTLARDITTQGQYGNYPKVYQQRCRVPSFDGNYVVLGSWVVGGQPRGMGIRESAGPITQNLSGFAPHIFD